MGGDGAEVRRLVGDLVGMSGNRDLIAWVEPLFGDTDAVHLGAVAASFVFHVPVPILEPEEAMGAGDGGETQHDIRSLHAADGKPGLEERDRVSADHRQEVTERVRAALRIHDEGTKERRRSARKTLPLKGTSGVEEGQGDGRRSTWVESGRTDWSGPGDRRPLLAARLRLVLRPRREESPGSAGHDGG